MSAPLVPPKPRRGARSPRRFLAPALLYAVLIAGAIPILIPFVWMLSSSLKTKEMVAEMPPRWIPTNVRTYIATPTGRQEVVVLVEGERAKVRLPDGRTDWVPGRELVKERRVELRTENYTRILTPRAGSSDDDFVRFLLNTLLICGLSVIGQVLSSSLVGWGFARLQFAGKNVLFMVMLATMMIPGQIGMIPSFMIFRQLGWIDTFLPLIVPAFFGSAFFAFLYRQYFLSIPLELDEAAKMDGCSPVRTYWTILLPLAKPVTVTVAVFTFLGAWNEFLSPLIYLNSDHKRTLSLALAKFQGAYGTDIPMLMAGATLMLLPVLVIYFLSQRAMVEGMVVGGVKG
ncbi:MAG: carbohydrate ABC transporter permease [Armatimonadota bacterium]